jgi:hypothetical protein
VRGPQHLGALLRAERRILRATHPALGNTHRKPPPSAPTDPPTARGEREDSNQTRTGDDVAHPVLSAVPETEHDRANQGGDTPDHYHDQCDLSRDADSASSSDMALDFVVVVPSRFFLIGLVPCLDLSPAQSHDGQEGNRQ